MQATKSVVVLAVLTVFVDSASVGGEKSGTGSVGEKREMPSYGGGGGGYQGGYEAAPYGGPPPPPHGYGGGGGQGATYNNPGFSVQTGFEGFLVPNSWYGLLPWGVEGILVVVVGAIVFVVLSVVIIGALAWLTGFGDYAIGVKDSARSLMPSMPSVDIQALTDITNTVLDAIDKYEEIQVVKNK